MKTLKMVKNKQLNLIARVKNAKHRRHQQVYFKLRNRERKGMGLLRIS